MSRRLAKSIGLSLLPTRSGWRIIHQVVCAGAVRLVARLGPQMIEPSECWIESSSPKLASRAKPSPLCESWCAARHGFAPPSHYVPMFVSYRDASVHVRSRALPLPKHLCDVFVEYLEWLSRARVGLSSAACSEPEPQNRPLEHPITTTV